MWHGRLLFKQEHFEISGNAISLHKSFFHNTFQWAVLHGQCSNWLSVVIKDPQGSITGTITFNYIDTASLFSTVSYPYISLSQLDSDLKKCQVSAQLENAIQTWHIPKSTKCNFF